MKITFVLPTVSMSGGIKVAGIYAKALAARGHSVVLVSTPPPVYPISRKLKSVLKGNGWPRDERPGASHLDGSGLDHRMLDRWRPVMDADVPDADVVIATWWETAEWVAALDPCKGAKVYFIQAHEVFQHLPLARCRATYQLPMHKIVIARWLKELMGTQYGDACVDVVPNSVDPAQFFAAVRGRQVAPTAGFMYSTAPVKGLDVALAALAIVRRRIPELRVVSFGSERESKTLPLPEYARFHSSPPQDALRTLYAQCDAWVTASRSEGFNLPAMEAMACRTPVVSTRTGWPEEVIVNGVNGVLTAIDDVAALAQGLEWIFGLSDSDWRRLSQRAYETASAGSWDDSVRRFEDALLHACHRAARGEIAGCAKAA